MRQEPPLAGHVPEPDRRTRSLLDSGRYDEARVAFDEVLGNAPNFVDADRWNRATVLIHRAQLALRLDRIPLALELAAEGWTELDVNRPNGAAAANTIGMLGYVLEGIGHRESASELMELSVQVARQTDDPETLAYCLTREGTTLILQANVDSEQDFSTAYRLLDEALSLASGGQVRRAALASSARALAGIGDADAAIRHAEQTLALSREFQDWFSATIANWVLAGVQRQRSRIEEARTYASRALEFAERINDTILMMRSSLDLAGICEELGDPVGEAAALRRTVRASGTAMETLQEGLGQALEQRRVAVQAQRMAMAAREAAVRDSLTGLINRRGLEQRAQALLEQTAAQGRVPWLVLVDVDWFKNINDHAGHAVGDIALQQVAHLLRRECRANDLVCRWAGDEFVILLVDSSDDSWDAGRRVAERIRIAVDTHDWRLVLGRKAEQPTVSIGVAAGPTQLDQLFTAADVALYRAKRAGRNRVEVDQLPPGGKPVAT